MQRSAIFCVRLLVSRAREDLSAPLVNHGLLASPLHEPVLSLARNQEVPLSVHQYAHVSTGVF